MSRLGGIPYRIAAAALALAIACPAPFGSAHLHIPLALRDRTGVEDADDRQPSAALTLSPAEDVPRVLSALDERDLADWACEIRGGPSRFARQNRPCRRVCGVRLAARRPRSRSRRRGRAGNSRGDPAGEGSDPDALLRAHQTPSGAARTPRTSSLQIFRTAVHCVVPPEVSIPHKDSLHGDPRIPRSMRGARRQGGNSSGGEARTRFRMWPVVCPSVSGRGGAVRLSEGWPAVRKGGLGR